MPAQIGFQEALRNPKLPPIPSNISKTKLPFESLDTATTGVGPKRTYLSLESKPPNVAYPPRPVPGSVADMDIIMEHCDFGQRKYVRDCLEVLRVGAGLDNGRRTRRTAVEDWSYIYQESAPESSAQVSNDTLNYTPIPFGNGGNPDFGLVKKRNNAWEPQLVLPPAIRVPPIPSSTPCEEDNPRTFHIFWAGPFTDKPYLAILSFLFTQNTGIHHKTYPEDSPVCRPQMWIWINPGPAASVPNTNAKREMFDQLKSNPWSAPFFHRRFSEVVKFKLWNTTEQLDGIPQLKDEWRTLKDGLFNSGGYVISVPANKSMVANATTTENDMLNRMGSKTSDSYDRLSVILSDMARFILCHRFGGIYLDADTLLLRDWEELWGWTGAFGYRWSRLEKYNTAVLRLHKQSALGAFLFRTSIRNGLDFHPMSISKYVADAHLESLFLRLPDALFDPAWLNTEDFQRDRPPQPYFTSFSDFFETPGQQSAAPQALGFNGFFKGAYSYHFHNFWWKPFDPSRNWPDLGPRFDQALQRLGTNNSTGSPELEEEDKRDLDWSSVLKRTFEAYIRGERPNMYGEWIYW